MRARVTDLWLKPNTPPRFIKAANDLSVSTAAKRIPTEWQTARFGRGRRWRVGWREPDGRQRTESFDKKKDAEALAERINTAFTGNTYVSKDLTEHTVADASDAWMASKLDVKGTTLNRYRRELDNYVLPQWGHRPLASITTANVQSWTADLSLGRSKTACEAHVALSPASIRNIVKVVLGGVFDYSVDQGWVNGNPVRKVVLPKNVEEDEDKVFLTIPQVEKLADVAATYMTKPRLPVNTSENPNSCLIRFLAYTGCRVGEATAIQVRDVNTDLRRLSLHHS